VADSGHSERLSAAPAPLSTAPSQPSQSWASGRSALTGLPSFIGLAMPYVGRRGDDRTVAR